MRVALEMFQAEGLAPFLSPAGGYPLHSVLLTLHTQRGKQWNNLLSQLCVQLGRALDSRVCALEGFQDAVKALTTVAGVMDEDGLEALAMGEGVGGAEAYNPVQLSRDAAALGHLRFDVLKRCNCIGRRYWLAGRRDFRECTKFTHVVDASRFVQDSLEGLMGAQDAGGEDFLVQWSPPQDTLLKV